MKKKGKSSKLSSETSKKRERKSGLQCFFFGLALRNIKEKEKQIGIAMFFSRSIPKFFLTIINEKGNEIGIAIFFSLVTLRNCPQKLQRKGKGNRDSNVFFSGQSPKLFSETSNKREGKWILQCFTWVSPQNSPQKHQRKGKGNVDCNVFSPQKHQIK